jgi:hypothetical protein
VEEHHWRDHIYRNLQALSDTIKHTEITHETGHSEWRVKALEVLPKDAFVWRDEYELIYDRTYGPQTWANLSDDTKNALSVRGKKAPPALNFRPYIANERVVALIQEAVTALGRRKGDGATNAPKHHSSDANADQIVAQVPPLPVGKNARPAPLPAAPDWKMRIQAEATAYCQRMRKLGANPTKSSILGPMAQWCRGNDVKTDSKIFPSEGYLRTHVLGGKHWDVPR